MTPEDAASLATMGPLLAGIAGSTQTTNPLIPYRPTPIIFPDTKWGMEALRTHLRTRIGNVIECTPDGFGMKLAAKEPGK